MYAEENFWRKQDREIYGRGADDEDEDTGAA